MDESTGTGDQTEAEYRQKVRNPERKPGCKQRNKILQHNFTSIHTKVNKNEHNADKNVE